jgi:N-acetylglucosamine-6-phosphate deacetylase
LTLLTASLDFLRDQLARLSHLISQSDLLRGAILGFHLEGPFLSARPGFFGAHPKEHLREPDWEMFEVLQRSSHDSIRMVTLAPELPESAEFIRKAGAANIFVCLGHTDASYEQLLTAVEAGARMFTHLGNGCAEQMHRHDNIIQRALAIPELMASLVPDGIHLPPLVLSNLVHALGVARLVMTTDCVSAAGAEYGKYQVGNLEVTIGENGIVMHPDGNSFAGSSLTMTDGYYNCVRYGGLSSRAAWQAWTRLRRIMFPKVKAPWLALPFPIGPDTSG